MTLSYHLFTIHCSAGKFEVNKALLQGQEKTDMAPDKSPNTVQILLKSGLMNMTKSSRMWTDLWTPQNSFNPFKHSWHLIELWIEQKLNLPTFNKPSLNVSGQGMDFQNYVLFCLLCQNISDECILNVLVTVFLICFHVGTDMCFSVIPFTFNKFPK